MMASPASILTDLLTVAEVAERLHCSEAWIKGQIGDGKLIAAKVAGSYLIEPDDFRRFFESLKCQKPTEARTSLTGAKTKARGTSGGTPREGQNIAAQALKTLRQRQKSSRTSSRADRKNENSHSGQTALVIPIKG